MLNRCFFVLLFCFSFSQKIIHDFGNKKIVDFDFYFENPKNSWDELSKENKEKNFNSFIKKELVLYDFERLGWDLSPSVFVKLKERKNQLAVNFYYEKEVVGSKINPKYLYSIKENIEREVVDTGEDIEKT